MEKSGISFINRKINLSKSTLTKAELKVAEFLLENPKEFIYSSVTDIADKSGTSITSVTRFTKKIGYNGLQDLKLSLSQHLEHRYFHDEIALGDNSATVKKKIFDANVEALRDTEKVLKEEELEKAVDFISASSKIAFFGNGGSSSIAIDAHHKFMRTGKVVEVYTDPHKQMIYSSLGKDSDLIIAISHEGTSYDLNEVLNVAKNNGIKIIAITQFSNSPITKIADISLFTMSRETLYRPESITSRIAGYTITDFLYVFYAMKIHDEMNMNISRIREGMTRLKNN